MQIAFHGLPSVGVTRTRETQTDAYGEPVMHALSSGSGTPCRHCLKTVPSGKPYLILAWRPFPEPSAYAETGPIFICADECRAATPGPDLPPMLQNATYTLRPYDRTPKIRYGLEQIVPPNEIPQVAADMLTDPETEFVDVRNPKTGCYQCRIRRD